MKKNDIPNLISGVRVLLIVPIVWYLLQHLYVEALILFVIAGLSDWLDGYLARKYHWGSHLGGWLDPLADKAMQVSVYVTLTLLGLIPWWLLLAVMLRDVIIVLGGLYYYYSVEKVNAAPSFISKLNTFMQIFLVVVLLVHNSVYVFNEMIPNLVIIAVLITTVLSGLDYVITWGCKAWKIKRG